MNKWQSFVSLGWYDSLISFIFRFVAKTSEPVLAFGVIVSAADFLQKGQLMSHNPTLVSAWAWTQAFAIEASTGPVLAASLQAFRTRDRLKGVLNAVLAGLLFVVGGAMLLLQLMSNITGNSEVAINPIVLYSLLTLRVLVASGIVALLCTKHMRFSGLLDETPAAKVEAAPLADPITPALEELLDRLDARAQQRIQAFLETTLERTVETVRVTIAEQTNPQLPTVTPAQLAIPAPAGDAENGLENLAEICDKDEQEDNQQPIYLNRFQSKEQVIAALLREHPHLTLEELADHAGCHVRTAAKWAAKYKEQA